MEKTDTVVSEAVSDRMEIIPMKRYSKEKRAEIVRSYLSESFKYVPYDLPEVEIVDNGENLREFLNIHAIKALWRLAIFDGWNHVSEQTSSEPN
jgi:ATP-dependent Lon protease